MGLGGSRLRKPLTPAQIIQLDDALKESFASHQALRRRKPAAQFIKFPQVPAVFAESIVVGGAGKLFGAGWTAALGHPLSDIRLSGPNGQTRRVEVKSTAHHGFQELKSKDLLADVLVWIHFGDRFSGGAGTIQVVIIKNPGKYISESVRLDIPRLLRRLGLPFTHR